MSDKDTPDSLPPDNVPPQVISLPLQSATPAMQSPTMGKLAEALAKAQKDMEPLEKNKTATIEGKARGSGRDYKYSYTYADLPAVIDNLRKVLADNGLSYIQRTRVDGNRLMLETRLMHTSGEWIASDWPLAVPDKEDPKQTAALLTYGRRYSLTSLCGISAEETDDDADHGRKAEAVKGKLGKSALTKALRAFVDDMRRCVDQADADQLEVLIASHKDILEQCRLDLYHEWWKSDPASDVKGIEDQIEEARRQIRAAEREAPQEPRESPQKVITVLRPEGGQREFPATNRGALEALSDLEQQCAINPDAWQANREMILHMAQKSGSEEVKKRALALEAEMEQTLLASG